MCVLDFCSTNLVQIFLSANFVMFIDVYISVTHTRANVQKIVIMINISAASDFIIVYLPT